MFVQQNTCNVYYYWFADTKKLNNYMFSAKQFVKCSLLLGHHVISYTKYWESTAMC